MKKIIFLYDVTGLMAQPWLNAGYECWCFDGQHAAGVTRNKGHVTVGMWLTPDSADQICDMVGDDVELVFGFPECTDLTVAGARHWSNKRSVNPQFQHDAMALADLVRRVGEQCAAPWAFENPIGALSTLYRKPDFIFHPCDYGAYLPTDDIHPIYPDVYPPRDAYNKATCIWHGNGFIAPGRLRVEPLHRANPGWAKCGGKSKRTKNIRSATPRGFAEAVYIWNH